VQRTLVTGLHSPWGLVFLPDGDAVLGSRDDGSLVRVRPNGSTRPLGQVPDVYHEGEGGLLGLAISPTFARDRQLFMFVTTKADNRVVRARLGKTAIGAIEPILTGIPRGFYHNGGGLCFDRAGHLFVSTGEGGVASRAQDKGSLGGKILRITRDGKPAAGNPFEHSPVYSYGHRNVESIAFNGDQLWAVEFGEHAYDELNAIVSGADYGWPQTQGRTSQPGITSPAAQWPTESAGPAGIGVHDSVAWIACLTGERLYRVPLHGRSAGASQAFFQGRFGRLRRVLPAPDGRLWLVTSNTDGRGTVRPGDDRILVLAAH
jgi:glucose/arabinose dehydrogenase